MIEAVETAADSEIERYWICGRPWLDESLTWRLE